VEKAGLVEELGSPLVPWPGAIDGFKKRGGLRAEVGPCRGDRRAPAEEVLRAGFSNSTKRAGVVRPAPQPVCRFRVAEDGPGGDAQEVFRVARSPGIVGGEVFPI